MVEALVLSLKLSLATTGILLLISLGIGYLLSFRNIPAKGLLEALLLLISRRCSDYSPQG